MRRLSCLAVACSLLVVAATLPAAVAAAEATIDIPELGAFRIGEPCVHRNLALYPLFAAGPPRAELDVVTLAEALQRKLVKVRETGNVNRLTIENRSDTNVFIQAGDIVRGGRQDRMVAYDVILPPRSGRLALDAFCVESGRWSRRGGEAAGEFASSVNRAATTKLALAARSAKSQSAVWQAVAEAQSDLAESVEVEVRDQRSPTSMELTLGNSAVRDAVRPYVESLRGCVDDAPGAVGVAIAINGRLSGASLFGWPELFAQSWPKLLGSAAVEAVAAGDGAERVEPPPAPAVGDFMWFPADVKTERHKILDGVAEHGQTYAGIVRFITRDEDLGWIHAEILRGQQP